MRLPSGKVLLALIPISLALLAVVLKLWVDAVEARRWEGMRAQLTEMAQEARARVGSRPVLRGQAIPGNGWDDYAAAMPSLKGVYWTTIGDFLSRSPKADRGRIQAWIAQHAGTLAALRRGATRTAGQAVVEWENHPGMLSSSNVMAALARCEARFLLESGKPREAAELLLDAAQYAGDIMRNNTPVEGYVGAAILTYLLEDLQADLLSSSLNSEELLDIARQLDLLDRGVPGPGDSYLNESMQLGFSFLKAGTVQEFFKMYGTEKLKVSARRYCFSERIMMADAFESHLKYSKQLRDASQNPWPEAGRMKQRCILERTSDPNPLLRAVYDLWGFDTPAAEAQRALTLDYFRQARVALRLLRAAAHYRATGEILTLEDPFGGTLLSSRTGNRLKLWSVGGDAKDDGGNGDWTGKQRDTVLEVDR